MLLQRTLNAFSDIFPDGSGMSEDEKEILKKKLEKEILKKKLEKKILSCPNNQNTLFAGLACFNFKVKKKEKVHFFIRNSRRQSIQEVEE